MTQPKRTIDKTLMSDALNRMMTLIFEAARRMPDELFRFYLDNEKDKSLKPVYNLLADSFLSLKSFCRLMFDRCWSQASAILRIGIEQVSATVVLLKNPELQRRYIDLHKEHAKYVSLSVEEQKSFRKGIKNINEYFDYSWFDSNDYGRDKIIKAAGLSELIVDIQETLNKFAHGSISIFQFGGAAEDWTPMRRHGRRIVLANCKLYDFLCCSTKDYIGNTFDALSAGQTFPEFETIYLSVFDATVKE